ncbi:D123-domain-containing protein [Auriculariales sp. MPI-PUGE-AT-0066]|nr:D123-domain-containing protein [Auriculariales sp. MPI-PUGE-AT-0066]
MPGTVSSLELFPPLTRSGLRQFLTSAWYPKFQRSTIKTTTIPLDDAFRAYMHADGVTIPRGADDRLVVRILRPAGSMLSDDEGDDGDDGDDDPSSVFEFPDLDRSIREAIAAYDGAVFPKLNWSAPKDARWISPSPPLRCLSPADVYLLIKSSDFVSHGIDAATAFEACIDNDATVNPHSASHDGLPLELVLKKYYVMQESREVRCFVRRNILVAISQRDPNYYEFWNEDATQTKIRQTVAELFQREIQQRWEGPTDYVVDLLLTRDLNRAHIIDFNPYAPRTDSLLFTFDELLAIAEDEVLQTQLPVLRAIDSRNHPSAARNTPQYAHNMVPLDLIQASAGQDYAGFAGNWEDAIREAMAKQQDDSD